MPSIVREWLVHAVGVPLLRPSRVERLGASVVGEKKAECGAVRVNMTNLVAVKHDCGGTPGRGLGGDAPTPRSHSLSPRSPCSKGAKPGAARDAAQSAHRQRSGVRAAAIAVAENNERRTTHARERSATQTSTGLAITTGSLRGTGRQVSKQSRAAAST
jgi:hypothetical protein